MKKLYGFLFLCTFMFFQANKAFTLNEQDQNYTQEKAKDFWLDTASAISLSPIAYVLATTYRDNPNEFISYKKECACFLYSFIYSWYTVWSKCQKQHRPASTNQVFRLKRLKKEAFFNALSMSYLSYRAIEILCDTSLSKNLEHKNFPHLPNNTIDTAALAVILASCAYSCYSFLSDPCDYDYAYLCNT